MKCRILWIFLLIPFFTLMAGEWDDWSIEGRVAYFYPTQKKFRRVYKDGGPDYQIEVSKRLCNDWFGWFNTSWFHQTGHSTGIRYHTRVDFIPVGLGIKRNICITPKLFAYIGGGVNLSFIRLKNDDPFIKKHNHRECVGGVVKLGLNYQLSECFYVGIFSDYLIQQFHRRGFRHGAYYTKIDASGFKFGGNIGYSF